LRKIANGKKETAEKVREENGESTSKPKEKSSRKSAEQ